jgi:hypothetical protein
VWGGLYVALPVWLFGKIAGDGAPPNGGWTTLRELWAVVSGLLVTLVVTLKFDLARVAIARDEARNARGGYQVAKRRLKGAWRASIASSGWRSATIQALFTNSFSGEPETSGASRFVVRQGGFVLSAMARVGFWGRSFASTKSGGTRRLVHGRFSPRGRFLLRLWLPGPRRKLPPPPSASPEKASRREVRGRARPPSPRPVTGTAESFRRGRP